MTQGRESKNGKFGREGMACGGVFSRTPSRKPVEFLASRRRSLSSCHTTQGPVSAAKAPQQFSMSAIALETCSNANAETHVVMKDFLMQKTHRLLAATRLVLSQ